jgi:rubrerythrin
MLDDQIEFSLSLLETELEEMRKDYIAFSKAYDVLRMRLVESTDLNPPRSPLLHEWSGSRAVCGALELSIHAIQRTIEEYLQIIQKVRDGEYRNIDKPQLKSV